MPQKKQTPGETPRNTEVFPVSPSKRLKRSLLFTSKTHGISSSEENGVPPIAPIGDRVAQLLWKPDDMERVVPDNCGENGVSRNPSHFAHPNHLVSGIPTPLKNSIQLGSLSPKYIYGHRQNYGKKKRST